jgi:hypothetical protein
VVYVIFVVEEGIEHRREDGIDREGAKVAKGRKEEGFWEDWARWILRCWEVGLGWMAV